MTRHEFDASGYPEPGGEALQLEVEQAGYAGQSLLEHPFFLEPRPHPRGVGGSLLGTRPEAVGVAACLLCFVGLSQLVFVLGRIMLVPPGGELAFRLPADLHGGLLLALLPIGLGLYRGGAWARTALLVVVPIHLLVALMAGTWLPVLAAEAALYAVSVWVLSRPSVDRFLDESSEHEPGEGTDVALGAAARSEATAPASTPFPHLAAPSPRRPPPVPPTARLHDTDVALLDGAPQLELELARDLLDAAGVPSCLVPSNHATSGLGGTGSWVQPYGALYVPENAWERAVAALDEAWGAEWRDE